MFSFVWLLGLVVLGVFGGVGVFEVIVLVLLELKFFFGIVLSVVVFYCLISVLVEIFVVGLVWLE